VKTVARISCTVLGIASLAFAGYAFSQLGGESGSTFVVLGFLAVFAGAGLFWLAHLARP
jgi:hypothetical protein